MLASFIGYFKQDNKEIVQTLEKEAPYLNELQKRFINLLEVRKEQEKTIDITCFYEEMPMPVVGTVSCFQSGCLRLFPRHGLCSH
jgi:hypothetical protein